MEDLSNHDIAFPLLVEMVAPERSSRESLAALEEPYRSLRESWGTIYDFARTKLQLCTSEEFWQAFCEAGPGGPPTGAMSAIYDRLLRDDAWLGPEGVRLRSSLPNDLRSDLEHACTTLRVEQSSVLFQRCFTREEKSYLRAQNTAIWSGLEEIRATIEQYVTERTEQGLAGPSSPQSLPSTENSDPS